MTIKEIREYFKNQEIESIPGLIKQYESDPRQGVMDLCIQYDKRYKKHLKELGRVDNIRAFDQVFRGEKEDLIAGIDEAGRGPLAGPVVAAAVILPSDLIIEGIDDSKKLSPEKREALYEEIMEKAISVGVGMSTAEEIDVNNILEATFKAMKKAVFSMAICPQVLLVDGNQTIPEVSDNLLQHAVIKGDQKSTSIAAASIIAKVTRDRIMLRYHNEYPEYDWINNKGYGSPSHINAIRNYGPSKLHRFSFLRSFL